MCLTWKALVLKIKDHFQISFSILFTGRNFIANVCNMQNIASSTSNCKLVFPNLHLPTWIDLLHGLVAARVVSGLVNSLVNCIQFHDCAQKPGFLWTLSFFYKTNTISVIISHWVGQKLLHAGFINVIQTVGLIWKVNLQTRCRCGGLRGAYVSLQLMYTCFV